jgi:hypothetical protein
MARRPVTSTAERSPTDFGGSRDKPEFNCTNPVKITEQQIANLTDLFGTKRSFTLLTLSLTCYVNYPNLLRKFS